MNVSSSSDATWPNFLVIGAAKSGSTALYYQLRQHPDIYMSPEKEPAFFAFEGDPLDYRGPGDQPLQGGGVVTTQEDYLEHFRDVGDENAVGEASVVYLYSEEAPQRIHDYIPQAKLIAILRHPVERAFSNYLDNLRHGFETHTDFAEAIAQEKTRSDAHWGWYWRYVDIGFYGRQLERYYGLFEQDQIRVHLYDDYISDPKTVLRDLFQFLGVDDSFIPDTRLHYNVSRIPRSNVLEAILKKPNPLKSAAKMVTGEDFRKRITRSRLFHRLRGARPRFEPNVAADLLERYREDILRLEDLIERDLSAWLVHWNLQTAGTRLGPARE